MLTKAQKDRWVKALISGRYKHGSGRLCDANKKYCCLGVEYAVNRPKTRGWKSATIGCDDLGDFTIPQKVQNELATLNDGDWYTEDLDLESEDCQVPFELIAGLCIDPWDGKTA